MPTQDEGKPMDSVNNGKMRIEYANNRLISTGEDGLDQLLVGERPDGTIGVDLAPPGVDVKTASDEELIWSTKFNSFKIVDSGDFDITVGGISAPDGSANNFASITHGLGYIPALLIYIKTPDGLWKPVHSGVYEITTNVRPAGTVQYIKTVTFDIWVTNTLLNAIVYYNVDGDSTGSSMSGGTWSFKYFLLREQVE